MSKSKSNALLVLSNKDLLAKIIAILQTGDKTYEEVHAVLIGGPSSSFETPLRHRLYRVVEAKRVLNKIIKGIQTG